MLWCKQTVQSVQQVIACDVDPRRGTTGQPIKPNRQHRVQGHFITHDAGRLHACGRRTRTFPVQQFVGNYLVPNVKDRLASHEDILGRWRQGGLKRWHNVRSIGRSDPVLCTLRGAIVGRVIQGALNGAPTPAIHRATHPRTTPLSSQPLLSD